MPSLTVENYLKAIYHLLESEPEGVSTNSLAATLKIKPATVTDMIGKLASARFVKYEKYYGATLTDKGKRTALAIIRKHRLWEVFLSEKLKFSWDEVHEIAEQLEHIDSIELTDRLDMFLGYPKTDPHGDPIPDKNGKITVPELIPLSFAKEGAEGMISGVTEHSPAFLQYLEKNNLTLGTEVMLLEYYEYDLSADIRINKKRQVHLSHEVIKHILIKLHDKH
ncbi:MAG: metal-dependent transcriptional regulator [Bacteroidia bacterium]|nr:metal-dependent transcriptional regulator [Bacteroidia bacterium]MCZ2277004.1 metal-dependent transcriptional regulator [Bacteroidia bacterium]